MNIIYHFHMKRTLSFSNRTIISVAVATVWAALCLGASTPAVEKGPPASPITINNAKGDAKIARGETAATASQLLGLPSISPNRLMDVRITDAHPFGDATSNRLVWLAVYDSLVIARRGPGVTKLWEELPDSTISLDIRLIIDPANGKVLLAYTPPRAEWVIPMLEPCDPEQEARKDGWVVGPAAPDSIRSSVVEVMRVVRNNLGPVARSAGQIVLRPREVSNRWPQRRIGNAWEPIHASGVAWIVEVMGTVTSTFGPASNEYWTIMVFLIDDKTLEEYRGMYLP